MSTAPPTALTASAIPLRPFADRAACLPASGRALYRRVLESFATGASLPLDVDGNAAATLIDADLIQADGGHLALAYPFSAGPTRHRVLLRDGRSFHAMCAFDALGIPYMLHEPGEVLSREPDGVQLINVDVDPHTEPTWTPTPAIGLAASGEGCCLAESACPHINLFTSPDAAARYLDTHAVEGQHISIADAASAGRFLFGDLLDRLRDTAPAR